MNAQTRSPDAFDAQIKRMKDTVAHLGLDDSKSLSEYKKRAIELELELRQERALRNLLVGDLLDQVRNFQSSQPAFGDPIALLESFERIPDGPWKQHVWAEHKLVLQVAQQERDWRVTKAEAQRVQDAMRLDGVSFSAQLAEIKDPQARSAFLKEHKAEIEAEVLEVQQNAASVRLNNRRPSELAHSTGRGCRTMVLTGQSRSLYALLRDSGAT
jgi:hypothetical protein